MPKIDHFQSLCKLTIGQLHQIAHDFYGIQLAVEELPRKPCNKEECYQFIFRLNFDNGDYMADRMMAQNNLELERIHLSNGDSTKRSSSQKALASLSSHVLMQLFPFSLVFRPDLKIISAGCQLKNLFPDDALVGQTLPNVSRMRRPKLLLTWGNVIHCRCYGNINYLFIKFYGNFFFCVFACL